MLLLLHAEGTKLTVMDGKSDGSTRCVFPGEGDGKGMFPFTRGRSDGGEVT